MFFTRGPEVGFASKSAGRYAFYGLLLGAAVFIIAYGTKFFIQLINGGSPSLHIYVTSYAVGGNLGRQTGLLFFAFCIVGNLINVVMEEGTSANKCCEACALGVLLFGLDLTLFNFFMPLVFAADIFDLVLSNKWYTVYKKCSIMGKN